MTTHIIQQWDTEGNQYDWIGVDEETARALYEANNELYYVREDAEGLIENEEDLEDAIKFSAVALEESYLWKSDYEEAVERNNVTISFEQFCTNIINNAL